MLTTKKLRELKSRISIGAVASAAGLRGDLIYSAIRPGTESRAPRELTEIEAHLLSLALSSLAADIRKAVK